LRRFELVDVAAVVVQDRTRRLDVAHAGELQLYVDAVGLSLRLQLGDFAARRLGGLGVLGSIRHLLLKRRNLLVALGDGLLPVHTAHLRLLLPEVFPGLRLFLRLCAMVITSREHADSPLGVVHYRQ
jgi:hypothetical protein